ncbi:unnamed protein product [Brugia pahangi]|uniref:Uncharacterized protein n=1 Tax=Brugia pahangi TaxID=6280 RepID=A0A0N4T5H1_BRUPA|nr:unnamed protein product [Brugia pahangi]
MKVIVSSSTTTTTTQLEAICLADENSTFKQILNKLSVLKTNISPKGYLSSTIYLLMTLNLIETNTTKSELQKKEKELKEKLSLFAERKKEQQKGATTKQILKNLGKDESSKKKSEVLKQCRKSSVDGKVSKERKTGSMRRVKSCSMHGNTTGNIETVVTTLLAVENFWHVLLRLGCILGIFYIQIANF